APHRAAAARNLVPVHRQNRLVQGQVWPSRNQTQQKICMLLQRRDAPAPRLSRTAARLPKALDPDNRRAGTDIKLLGRRAPRRPAFNFRNHSRPHVFRIGLRHRPASQNRINADRLSHPSPSENLLDSIGTEHALAASDVRIITKNGLYDWGWLYADAGLEMLSPERLEEIDALATIADETRWRYSLDALCAWRGLPGKDETLLCEGCAALGLITSTRKKFKPQPYIWRLPAHLVGPYAETDAVRTLELFESLNPVLDREGTRDAYRLEIELLPMVLRMRRRGIRIDISSADQARDFLLRKRDTVLAQICEKLGTSVGMDEINGRKWLISTFDRLGIAYPLTEKGNPSFKRGKKGWMQHSSHWLPPLIAAADQL